MAEHFAPGVKRFEEGRYDRYIGTADALIAAGLVESHQLPGQLGNGKCMVSFLPDGSRIRKGSTAGHTPGSLRVRRCGKKFEVTVVVDDRVREERHAKLLAAHERESAYEEAKERAERELASMPHSTEAYRGLAIDLADAMFVAFTKSLGPREYHGYSYEPATIRAFQAAVRRLYMVLRSGRVIFDQQRHDARIAAINTEVAKFAPPGAKQITERPQLRLVQSHNQSILTA